MTPNELADELGYSAQSIRAYLREAFPRTPEEKWKPWQITAKMARAVRARFA